MPTIKDALDNLTKSLEGYFYFVTTDNLAIAEPNEIESDLINPDLLLFQYTIEEIFDDVKMMSAQMAKYAVSEKTGDKFDAITVTEEDRSFFERFCKDAAMYMYSRIQGLAKLIDPGLLYDEGVDIVAWQAATLYPKGTYVLRNNVIYKALAEVATDPEVDVANWEEMPDYLDTKLKITYLITYLETFDANIVKVWDENFKEIIVMYVLEKIFKFRNIAPDLLAVVLDERIAKERELTSTIHSRKTPVKRFVAWI